MTKPAPDFLAILQTLAKHEVEFIIVGGVGAVLQGAPIATFDLDLVHSRNPVNIHRLIGALRELEAGHRTHSEIRRQPDETHLSSPGHQLLMTRYGPLDLLGAIGAGRGYEALLPNTVELEVSPGVRVRALELAAIIRSKEEVGSEKDLAVLPVLRQTLESMRRRR